MKIKVLITSLLVVGCQSATFMPGVDYEIEVDWSKVQLRHGLELFNGPRPTKTQRSNKDSLKRGQALFQKNCVPCHGTSGRGDGPKAKLLQKKPANLQALSKKLPGQYLIMQVNTGKGEMPKWESLLSPDEGRDVVEYIRTLGTVD